MDNKLKIKLIVFLVCVLALTATIQATYSRYASNSTGTVSTEIARWQIFVNNNNVTESYNSSMTFTPNLDSNVNIAANKIAPTSTGYFDIAINPTNVDVSFTYNISFSVPEDSIISDVNVTEYAIYEGTEITAEAEGSLEKIDFSGTSITDTLFYQNGDTPFSFSPFVLRVYFEWIDGENETMDDEADNIVGNAAASDEDFKFELNANINFKQYIGEENNAPEDEPPASSSSEPDPDPEPEPEPSSSSESE